MTNSEFEQQQIDSIADALHELMATNGPASAKQGLVKAVNSWYDYHYHEMEKWSILKRLLERPL